MATWKILLISLGVIILVGGIICAIVIPLVLKKRKNKKESSIDTGSIPSPSVEIIQLKAVKLLSGSGRFGYESPEEVQDRLSKLSKEDFIALEVDDYPFNQEQWDALEGKPEEIYARNEYEMGIFFAYNYNKELKENGEILKRTF